MNSLMGIAWPISICQRNHNTNDESQSTWTQLVATHPFTMTFWLKPGDTEAFAHLTAPALAQALPAIHHPLKHEPLPATGALFAVGELFACQPAALAVLRAGPDKTIDILTLMVAEPLRRLGLASALLRWIQQQAMVLGWRSLSLSYPLNHASTAAMVCLTDPELGWQKVAGLRLIHLDRTGGQSLLQRLTLVTTRLQQSQRFTLLPWNELAAEAQQQLVEQLQTPGLTWPLMQDPDQAYERLDGNISTLLLDQGIPAGWLLAHQIGPSLFRVTHWLVAPDHQRHGIGLLLLGHTIEQALSKTLHYTAGCFGVNPANRPMLRLCKRQIEPFARSIQENIRCSLSTEVLI